MGALICKGLCFWDGDRDRRNALWHKVLYYVLHIYIYIAFLHTMTSGQQYLNVAFINLKLIAMGTTLSAVMGCVTTPWSVKLC